MKKAFLEIGKAVLAFMSLMATFICFIWLADITGILYDETTILKILVQFICFGIPAYVLYKTRACVLTAILFGISFCVFFLCMTQTGLSPIVAIMLLGQVIPIYFQEKEALKNAILRTEGAEESC